jgi:hypothetical protein
MLVVDTSIKVEKQGAYIPLTSSHKGKEEQGNNNRIANFKMATCNLTPSSLCSLAVQVAND